ncbi:MAG: cation:proton antiporter [Verrucomicrobiota bacterium]|jgi:Kef-type K+ transport system membrane component KefB
MRKIALVYVLVLVVFGTGIFFALRAGKQLEPARGAAPAMMNPQAGLTQAALALRDNLRQPLSRLLVQLILIVLLARVFGALAWRAGQPSVIGEMVAGLVLGPSVLGGLWPAFFQFVFPADSLGALSIMSQVGVILFMFLVGMELDLPQARRHANTALMVSHVSIIFPCFLGVVVALFLFRSFAPPGVSFLPFGLFLGIAMSITAFPVLARILQDRGLTRTPLGSMALTCAAIGDVTAWCVLAFVVAVVKAGGLDTLVVTLVLALAFLAAMSFLVKPWLNHFLSARPQMAAAPGRGVVVAMLMLVFSAALFTEVIGIHALFGAFLAGVVMPARPEFRAQLRGKLENFSSALLLPLFFAFTGLRTQLGLLHGWEGWTLCAGIIVAATLGKMGGSMLAARWTGLGWHDAFALGALMNTRGLVELIVLNLGLDLGILSPPVFTMLVVMALVTTAMTGPLLTLGRIYLNRGPAPATDDPAI